MYNCDASDDRYPAQPYSRRCGRAERIHMPKKAHGRQAKQRTRSRRATAPTQTATPTYPNETVPAAPAAPPVGSTVATPRAPAAASRNAPRPGAARRAPTITVNYAYLHRDLIALGILGPAMVVLLIVAYLVFHGA